MSLSKCHSGLACIVLLAAAFPAGAETNFDSAFGVESASPNLMLNGGFEYDFTGWWPSVWGDQKSAYEMRMSLDRKEFHGGRQSLRIENPFLLLVSFAARGKEGHSYTLSAWMKSDKSIKVDLGIRNKGLPTIASVPCILGPSWKRYSVTGKIAPGMPETLTPVVYCYDQERIGATIWIDDVVFEEGTTPSAQENEHLEFGILSKRIGDIFVEGETPVLYARIFNPDGKKKNLSLSWIVRDFNGVEVLRDRKELTAVEAYREEEIPIKSAAKGLFFCHFALSESKGGHALTGVYRYGMITRVPPHKKGDTLFGVDVGGLDHKSRQTVKNSAALMEKIGSRVVRITVKRRDSDEYEEATTGKTNYVKEMVDTYRAHGIEIIMTLTAVKHARFIFNMGDDPNKKEYWINEDELKLWHDSIKKLAAYYKGKVKYWEIGNETATAWASKEGEAIPGKEYARALIAGVEAVKSEDPDAVIVAGGSTASERSLNPLYEAFTHGAGEYFDLIGFHGYAQAHGLVGQLDILKERFAKFRCKGRSFDTETGLCRTRTEESLELRMADSPDIRYRGPLGYEMEKGEYSQGASQAQRFIAHQALQIEGFAWHSWPTDFSPIFGWNLHPSPGWIAMNTAACKLSGAKLARRLSLAASLHGFIFQKGKDSLLVALWSDNVGDNRKMAISLPSVKPDVTNMVGGKIKQKSTDIVVPLRISPVYIEVKGLSVADLARVIETAKIRAHPD